MTSPLPLNAENQLLEITRRSRRLAFKFIAPAIYESENRLFPFYDTESCEMNWRELMKNEWTIDEVLSLPWLRSIFEEKMYVKPDEVRGMFPADTGMKVAILCALAVVNHASYIIHDFYLPPSDHRSSAFAPPSL